MKPLTKKVLESGLIDKHMALMLERWKAIPDGASDLVNEDALKDATKEGLMKLGEELGDEVDKLRTLKETQLDLDKLRWPVEVDAVMTNEGKSLALHISAVIDRMGRLYFRFQDVEKDWFVPGFFLDRTITSKEEVGRLLQIREEILESTVLYTGDQPVCVQVTVHRVA